MVRGAQEKKKMTDSEQRRMFVFRLRDIVLDMVWLCSVIFNVRVESSSFFQTLTRGNSNLENNMFEIHDFSFMFSQN